MIYVEEKRYNMHQVFKSSGIWLSNQSINQLFSEERVACSGIINLVNILFQ